jgi:hypothetical protein
MNEWHALNNLPYGKFSRETNASFDHNFLFHPLDLKLEIVMQKYDVKNQNPYWRALQVETL